MDAHNSGATAAELVIVLSVAASSGSPFWEATSRLLGWLYFAAWTVSFWPQALLIYRRRSVAGISLDFLSLNALGFLCYSAFNVAFLVSSTIQQQYRETHHGQENLVRWNDAFFALHAFVLASWQLASGFLYKRAPGQKISLRCRVALAGATALLIGTLAVCIVGGGTSGDATVRWIDFVNLCSYVKLVITLVKYSPQIALHFARKSTRGFAIEGILLDLTGGLLSLLQLMIDAQLINHDWSDVTGDPGKLGLSLFSIVFDVIIMVQHYFLYGSRAVEGEEWSASDAQTNPADEEVVDPERQQLLPS